MPKTYVSDARLYDLAHGGQPLPQEVIGIADELQLRRLNVHADPTGKTREPPHCPTCDCPTPGLALGVKVIVDPSMPTDQIELHGSNGQVVRVVNLGSSDKSAEQS